MVNPYQTNDLSLGHAPPSQSQRGTIGLLATACAIPLISIVCGSSLYLSLGAPLANGWLAFLLPTGIALSLYCTVTIILSAAVPQRVRGVHWFALIGCAVLVPVTFLISQALFSVRIPLSMIPSGYWPFRLMQFSFFLAAKTLQYAPSICVGLIAYWTWISSPRARQGRTLSRR